MDLLKGFSNLRFQKLTKELFWFTVWLERPELETKIAVYSENPNVDPVGACIGQNGSRINRIIDELNGEKIDVIPYEEDAARFIENALSPAKDLHIFVTDEKKKEALAIVNKENLSLAIGRKGLNVRLATKLNILIR